MSETVKPSTWNSIFSLKKTGKHVANAKPGNTKHSAFVVLDALLLLISINVAVGLIYGIASLTDIGLLEKQKFTVFLSIGAPFITMGQYVSPTPMVRDAIKKMDPQNLPTAVFQSQAACNVLSISYGIQIANPAVLVTNMFGLTVQIMFLAVDHYVRTPRGGWFKFTARLATIISCSLYCCAFMTPINILGHMITVFNVVLFAAPLGKLGTILRTKNTSSMSSLMTSISIANNTIWALYALMLQDSVLFLPSILGYVLSGFQALVILWGQGSLPFDLGFLLLPCKNSEKAMTSPESGPVLPQRYGRGGGHDAEVELSNILEEVAQVRPPEEELEDFVLNAPESNEGLEELETMMRALKQQNYDRRHAEMLITKMAMKMPGIPRVLATLLHEKQRKDYGENWDAEKLDASFSEITSGRTD